MKRSSHNSTTNTTPSLLGRSSNNLQSTSQTHTTSSLKRVYNTSSALNPFNSSTPSSTVTPSQSNSIISRVFESIAPTSTQIRPMAIASYNRSVNPAINMKFSSQSPRIKGKSLSKKLSGTVKSHRIKDKHSITRTARNSGSEMDPGMMSSIEDVVASEHQSQRSHTQPPLQEQLTQRKRHSHGALDISDFEADFDSPKPLPGACTMEEAMECVVKIFVTSAVPNYLQPWQKKPSSDHMGSGFVILGNRIITNAHVVADALVVMVRRPGSSAKHIARVVASAHECDLALLEVDDQSFWEENKFKGLDFGHHDASPSTDSELPLSSSGTEKLTMLKRPSSTADDLPGVGKGSVGAPWWDVLAPDVYRIEDAPGDVPVFTTPEPFKRKPGVLYVSPAMPLLQSSVVVVGYPLGGDNVCITQGVVSRIEPTHYAHTGSYLLAIQIDAAINPGNSGGPALVDGRVVGVAFQNITNASNVGYIIPAPIIIHFLRDVQRGAYRLVGAPVAKAATTSSDQRFFAPYTNGFCSLGIYCQETTNPSLRDYIGLNSCVKLTESEMNGYTMIEACQDIVRQSPEDESNKGFTVYNYETTNIPAAYSHYHTLIPHIKDDVKQKRRITHVPGNVSHGAAQLNETISTTRLDTQYHREPISGVLINEVSALSSIKNVVKPGDVLLAVDGHEVGSDGSVHFRGHERISFDHIVALKHDSQSIQLTILRKKQTDDGDTKEDESTSSKQPPSSIADDLKAIEGDDGKKSEYNLKQRKKILSSCEQCLPDSNIPRWDASRVPKIHPDPNTVMPEDAFNLALSVVHNPVKKQRNYMSTGNVTRHYLCVSNDFEVLTVTASVGVLPTLAPNVYDRGTAYVFFGGLLFVPMSFQYLKELGNDIPVALTMARHSQIKAKDEEKIILAQVLQDNETVGYPYLDRPVTHICGVSVRNMTQLLEVVQVNAVQAAVTNHIKSKFTHDEIPHLIKYIQSNGEIKPDATSEKNGENGEGLALKLQQTYKILSSLSDIMCSHTDLQTYRQSLNHIYHALEEGSLWKSYISQIVVAHASDNPAAARQREEKPIHIHRKHDNVTQQALSACFDREITSSTSTAGFKTHMLTIQTSENKVIALDMEKAILSHFKLKYTLNI